MDFLNMLLFCAGAATEPATEIVTTIDEAGNAVQVTNEAGEVVTQAVQQQSSWYIWVIYIVLIGAFIYFIMIRPSRKQKKQQEETMSSMQPGDSVMTTSGFYGTIVAVNGDTIIVEFGNNKNCRIPMAKQAVSQVEKAGESAGTSAEAAPVKKFFGRKKAEETTESTESTQSSQTSDESSSDSSSDKTE